MATPSIEMLIADAWQDAMALFDKKIQDYGEPPFDLGAAGQFADMHRKMRKLKRALWDGQILTGEQPLEICQDMMGHLALTIAFLQHEELDKATGKSDPTHHSPSKALGKPEKLVHWGGGWDTHRISDMANVTKDRSKVNCRACLEEMDR